MSLNHRIAELARLAVGVETTDLPSILRLRDGLLELPSVAEFPAESPSVRLIDQASASLESIVMREIDSAETAMAEVNRVLDYLQRMAQTLEHGGDVETIPVPVLAGDELVPCVASAPDTSDCDGAVRVVIDAELDKTLREFISEARDHLQLAETALLELESDPSSTDHINTVFRAFHTIKGVAGFLNLSPIVRLSHSAEFLLDAARSNAVEVNAGFIELVLRATDVLGELVGSFEESDPPLQSMYDRLLEELEDARAKGAATNTTAQLAPRNGCDAARNVNRPAPPPSREPGAGRTVQTKQARPETSDKTVKVDTQRLDELVDMVGELVISHQMLVQDPAIASLKEQKTHRTLAQMEKIIRDLQENAISLRMVALHGSFQKMTRLVRDLSKKSGKDIEIRLEGEETEIDRNVVEELGDPLVHMVRNACDHGIESPEERRAAGKPRQGRLTLRAFHEGGSLVIELEDDGKGLDREKLIAKALDRGVLLSTTDTAELSDAEVYDLIFEPGFSTADSVTDISGRGVGMDVVKRNIEALRGSIEIRSEKGKGSTFVLSLPLTMAIIDGMVVRIGNERFVVPTLAIEQSFRTEAGQVSTVMGELRVVSVRGTLLPVFPFGWLFGVVEDTHDIDDALFVVVKSNNSRMCLVVDKILGQQQVVIKSLGESVGRIKGVSGATILGDGRVALILDIASLFTEMDEYTHPAPRSA